MGTRSNTVVRDGRQVVAVMYRQYDGYLTGHGRDLLDFLTGFEIVNGFNDTHREVGKKVANGAGCFAAQLVTHFKTVMATQHVLNKETDRYEEVPASQVGNIYLCPSSESKVRHDYSYEVIFGYEGKGLFSKPKELLITVWHWDEKIHSRLTLEKFKEVVEREEKAEKEEREARLQAA